MLRRRSIDGKAFYQADCEYCDGSGEYESDNNGPIGDCPVCSGDGHYWVDDEGSVYFNANVSRDE